MFFTQSIINFYFLLTTLEQHCGCSDRCLKARAASPANSQSDRHELQIKSVSFYVISTDNVFTRVNNHDTSENVFMRVRILLVTGVGCTRVQGDRVRNTSDLQCSSVGR